MYSETADFQEKQEALARMAAAIRQLCDRDMIDDCRMALEIGGSGGLLAGMISQKGPRVICTDIDDVQVKYNGDFPRRLKDKFARNGYQLDLGKIEFHTQDAQNLIYGTGKFDLVFSLNALEHIPDPIAAIREVGRVLKPGGLFYATFDPVWTADSGSHFIHYTQSPWLHLLLDDDAHCAVMQAAGAADWELAEYRQAMNRRPAAFYLTDFRSALETVFSRLSLTHWSGCVSTDYATHENLAKASAKTGFPTADLLIRGFQVVAIK